MALFAALSYAVTQSGRGGGNTRREAYTLDAAQLMNTAAQFQTAIHRLKLIGGCSDTEISFENSGAYVNPTAPPDKHCHVFDTAGGGLSAPGPLSSSNGFAYERWAYEGAYKVEGLGTTEHELVLTYVFGDTSQTGFDSARAKAMCEDIDSKLGLSTTAIRDDFPTGQAVQFKGVYGPGEVPMGDESGATKLPPGLMQACFFRPAFPGYVFYTVLLVR